MSLAQGHGDAGHRRNLLREYLQACVLRSLHESEAFQCLSFVGGTALRFLYELARFSENLDFSLESPSGYTPVAWMEKLKRDLSLSGFDAQVTWNQRKTVHVAWIRFAGLLRDAGLAGLPEQKLSIKIEIDTHPAGGGVTENDLVNRHMIISLRHHDLSSLMAGKIHAVIARRYPKGRDWYDLVWYRAKRPPVAPNLHLLQNALDQTQGKGTLSAANWVSLVLERLAFLDGKALMADVVPFLERPQEVELFSLEQIRTTLGQTPGDTRHE